MSVASVLRDLGASPSPRRRVAALVAIAAVAASGIAAVAVVASGGGGSSSAPAAMPKPRPGRPPLSFALGFRDDPEARDLVRGAMLYNSGHPLAARKLFERSHSLEARIGTAFTAWPNGTLDQLEQLAVLYPQSAVVQLHLGFAELWARQGDPVESWQLAADAEPDTPYAILAGNLLHPKLPRGLPAFIPSFAAPPEVTRLPARRQLAVLGARARNGGVRDLILYGVGLQRIGRPVSAERAFRQAAHLAPRNVEAQVAAAVGSFSKDDPTQAFGQLGPLTRTFPDEPTVRFHLGVLLLWTGRIGAAERQFRLASRIKPGSPLAREAVLYRDTIRRARSG